MSFTRILNQELEQGKLIIMAAVDMFMEKGPKNVRSILNRLKSGKISRKDLLCMKM